jgi:polyisoprenyl-phosphate glycosyltransferase
MDNGIHHKIVNLPGPILVLGASGFIGAHLFRALEAVRNDVYGTSSQHHPWRLHGTSKKSLKVTDLLFGLQLKRLFNEIRPKTIFNCAAYGAYSFQTDRSLIYRTNVDLVVDILELISTLDIHAYVHAGSSSEYGGRAAGPNEQVAATPNSHYAASKAAATNVIYYMGAHRQLPCANLRVYSAYGPLEDSSRLMPNLIKEISMGRLPDFVDPQISRDFVFIDDVTEAFVDVAGQLSSSTYGQSFNIGTGVCTTIGELAELAKNEFHIEKGPVFDMPNREWDVTNWYADPKHTHDTFGWYAKNDLAAGLKKTYDWYTSLTQQEQKLYLASTKRKVEPDIRFSISTIVACYQDVEAIPVMYERLTQVFEELRLDYEIIFVNDASPDESEATILEITARDWRVTGISHSRNFGSQAAFRSGMELATKNAVVLMDGDLQDPPELIKKFVGRWKEGYQVVYGRRVAREGPWYMQVAYKAFYRLFDRFSYITIPHDAGDFSLLDIRVVKHLLSFPERDMFLRGLRASVGFNQTGVDYNRPERMFGKSTNSLLRNFGWAKKGLFSFSYAPLNFLTLFSIVLLAITMVLVVYQVFSKLFFPDSAPKGITTLLLATLGFGSTIMLAISLLGEYIARIFEEVKQRPHFIRKSILREGEQRDL